MTAADDQLLRTVAEYCRRCDDGRFDELGLLFRSDAQLVVRGTVTRGRDAIRETIAALQNADRRGRHMVSNAVVDVAGDVAKVVSDFVFFRPGADGPLEAVNTGRYLDELVRTGQEWLFTRREIVLVEAPAQDGEGS